MGSRAGAYFFRKVIDYSPAETDQDFLEIIFHNNSSIPDRTRAIVYQEESPLENMLNSIRLFNQNKVQVIAMSCITAYYYYQEISTCTSAEILNPLSLVADAIRKNHPDARRVGILATTGTLRSGLFHAGLKECDVEIVTLDAESQESLFMRSVYMKNGFKSAVISGEAGCLMDQCIQRLMDDGAELVIGGCTEVSIAIDLKSLPVPYLDMLDLLARKTVEHCYAI